MIQLVGERWCIEQGTEPGSLDNCPGQYYIYDTERCKRAIGSWARHAEAVVAAETYVRIGFGKGGRTW